MKKKKPGPVGRCVLLDTPGIQSGVLAHRSYYKGRELDRLTDQTLEEMAELAVELLHERRVRGGRLNILREYCDVVLCLEFLGRHLEFDADYVRPRVSSLAVQLSERLEMQKARRRHG